VATRCGAPVELLRNGELGRLAPVGDWATLADAMLATLDASSNPDLLKDAATKFTVSAVAGHYLDALMPRGAP